MKTLSTFFFCLCINFLSSQTLDSLEFNNAKAYIMSRGQVFDNSYSNYYNSSYAAYGMQSDNGAMGIYASHLWFAGLDDNDSLHACISKYTTSDLQSGPIANDYNHPYYINRYIDKIWKVSNTDIINHLSNYQSNFYVVPDNIAEWPAHGEPLNGEAQNLAPFVDHNNNGIYDPENGDFPAIRGQEAVYLIFNDENSNNPNKLGLEYHFMYYQYASNDAINNTTFLNVTVYNRSNTTYHDFRIAQMTDFDIGGATDDYLGCDSTKDLLFGYNAGANDYGQIGIKFGLNPPAYGVKQLNQPMDVCIYYNMNYLSFNNNSPHDYWNNMHAKWNDTTHVEYGGIGYGSGIQTNYTYTGNPYTQTGWTEGSVGNYSGDRRMMMSTGGAMFPAGSSLCIDYAYIYSRSGGDNLANVNTLYHVADSVQQFYNNQNYECMGGNNITLNSQNLSHDKTLSVYPNPNNGAFNIIFEGNYNLNIYALNGTLAKSINSLNNISNINTELSNGMYILQIEQKGNLYYKKIAIK
jgi:hypothetical protein